MAVTRQGYRVFTAARVSEQVKQEIIAGINEWWKFNKGTEKMRIFRSEDAEGNRIRKRKLKIGKNGKIYRRKGQRVRINFHETGAFYNTLTLKIGEDLSITYDSKYKGVKNLGTQTTPLIDDWKIDFGGDVFRPSKKEMEKMEKFFIAPRIMDKIDVTLQEMFDKL